MNYPYFVMRRLVTVEWGERRHQYAGWNAPTMHRHLARRFHNFETAAETPNLPGFKPVMRVQATLAPTPCRSCGDARQIPAWDLLWSEPPQACPSCTPPLTSDQQAL